MASVRALRDSKVATMSADAGNRGSASPLVVAMIAVVMVLAGASAQVGSALVGEARASAAADLVALGAARTDRDLRAQGLTASSALAAACDVAASVAHVNQAALTDCSRGAGASVVVSVSVPIRGWPQPATATARAGPARG